jgi:hypothetical protein
MIYTVVLAIVGVAIAMALIGLGIFLGKRTQLKRSCAAGEEHGKGESCPSCSCEPTDDLGFDSDR